MAKLSLPGVGTGFQSTTRINSNFNSIEDEFQSKVLYRDNPDGEPNAMQNNLDMNSNRILNLPIATSATEPVRFDQLNGAATSIVVSPLSFGAVGDNSTDDTAALQEALEYAKSLVTAGGTTNYEWYGSQVVVNGQGKSYCVSDSLDFTSLGGVVLADCRLRPVTAGTTSSWSGVPIVKFGNFTAEANSHRYSGLKNVMIECDHKADGIHLNNVNRLDFDFVHLHGFPNYGIRVRQSATDTRFNRVQGNQFWATELPNAPRTGIGFYCNTGDIQMTNCVFAYCKYPVVQEQGSVLWNGCHLYNDISTDQQRKFTITGAANNGSGKLRLTFASTTSITQSATYLVPWLAGVTGVTGNSASGPYVANVINGTTVDFNAYNWGTSASWSVGAASILHYDDEVVNMIIGNDSAEGVNCIFVGGEFDDGKVLIKPSTAENTTVNITGNNFYKSQSVFRTTVEFRADATASYNLAGIVIANNSMIDSPGPFRFYSRVGSFASDLRCTLMNNVRRDRQIAVTRGRFVIPGGTQAAPGVFFTAVSEIDEDDIGTASQDSDTGFYKTESDAFGLVCGGTPVQYWTTNRSIRETPDGAYEAVDTLWQQITASASLTHMRITFAANTAYAIAGKVIVNGVSGGTATTLYQAEVPFIATQTAANAVAITLGTEVKFGDTATVPQATVFTTGTGTNYVNIILNTKSLASNKAHSFRVEHRSYQSDPPTLSIVTP